MPGAPVISAVFQPETRLFRPPHVDGRGRDGTRKHGRLGNYLETTSVAKGHRRRSLGRTDAALAPVAHGEDSTHRTALGHAAATRTHSNHGMVVSVPTLKNEMDVAMAEASLASAKSRRSRGQDQKAEEELHAALERLGELDRKREALQSEARSLRLGWAEGAGRRG